MPGLNRYEEEVGRIYDFVGLDSDIALTLWLKPADLDPEVEARLHAAGMGMAEARIVWAIPA